MALESERWRAEAKTSENQVLHCVRNMDVRRGGLNLDEHYRHSPSANSSYLWRADLAIEALSHRGMVAAEGRKLLLKLTASEQKN